MKRLHIADTIDHVTEFGAASGSRLAPEGTVFIVVRGMILAHTFPVCLAMRPMAFNQDVKAICCDESEILPEYLATWLVGNSSRLLGTTTESTHGTKRIALEDIQCLPIICPPLDEQRRILKTLRCIGADIANAEAVVSKLCLMRNGLHADLLADTSAPMRPFGQFVTSSAFGPRFSSDEYSGLGNVALLRTTDIDDQGGLDLAGMPDAVLDVNAFRAHFLQRGDLVITRSGTCGIAAVFEGWTKPVLPGAFLIRFRLRERLLADFARYYFNSLRGQARLLREAVGGVQKNLKGSVIKKFLMPVPETDEQRRIVAILDAHDARIRSEQAKLDKLRALKKGLLDDLLAGRVRVPVSADALAASTPAE